MTPRKGRNLAVSTRLSDAVYVRLRDWILDGTLTPGEPLSDEALAEAFGTSRTPVREALQRLQAAELVIVTASRRRYVSSAKIASAQDVFPIVATLETMLIELAQPIVDATALQTLRHLNLQLAEAMATGNVAASVKFESTLHATLSERCCNQELLSLFERFSFRVQQIERTFWRDLRDKSIIRDHEELIAVLHDQDGNIAKRIVGKHWEHCLEMCMTTHL